MRKAFTLKAMLVALLLAVGSSISWAQTVLYERTAGSWSDNDLSEWTAPAEVTLSIDGGLKAYADNSGYTVTKSLATTDNSVLTVDATWDVGQSTGRAGSYNYLKIGDVEVRAYGQDQKTSIVIGGTETVLSEGNYAKLDARGGTWTVNLTINQATGEVSYSINLNASGTKTGTGTSTSGNFKNFIMGYERPGRVGVIYQTLQAVQITEEVQSVQVAEYTVYYRDTNGNDIKTPALRSGVVGEPVTITEADKADFYVDGIKYAFSHADNDNASITIDGLTEVYLYFSAKAQFTATLNAVDDDGNSIREAIATGSAYEGDELTLYFPKGVQDESGRWYLADQLSTDGKALWYGYTFDGDETQDVFYTLNPDVKYYAEVEDLTPSRSWAVRGAGGAQNRFSNGQIARLYANSSVSTASIETAGTYMLTLMARNQSGSSEADLTLKVADADGTETVVEAGFSIWAKGSMNAQTVEVQIPAGGKVVLANENSYNSNLELDYLYLRLKPETFNAVVKAVDENGQTLADELRKEEVVKGESTTLYFSKGLQVDGAWYVADPLSADGSELWYGVYFDDENTVEVTFRKDESIVYFAEVEKLTPSKRWATTASKSVVNRTSDGAIGRLAAGASAKTDALPGGTYNVTLWGRSSANSDANIDLIVETASGAQTVVETGFEAWPAGGAGSGEKTVRGVEVPEGGFLVLQNPDASNNSNLEMDYIYLDTKSVATSIRDVQPASVSADVYNLQGQRVSQPARGIYVKNGRKVVVK